MVLNAIDAAARGAVDRDAHRDGEGRAPRRRSGVVTLRDDETGALREITAKVLVNAAGPWVAELLTERLGLPVDAPVRLVKGSHIVVPTPLHARPRLHLPERRRPHRLRHSL